MLDAIARAEDPRVIELDRNMPWREAVLAGAPEALYVIYPKSDGWGLQAVPTAPGSFENRRSLPSEWGGLRSDELAAATASRTPSSRTWLASTRQPARAMASPRWRSSQ